MIIDSIADRMIGVVKYNDYNMRDNKRGWMEVLFFWRNLGDFMDDAIVALAKEDWRAFKKSMMDYMENLGYKGCYYYNQFKRLSLKKISECIINDGVDMSELWYISEDNERPNGYKCQYYTYYQTENEAKEEVKSRFKEIIRAYEGRGVKFEKYHLTDDHAWLITTEGEHIKLNVRKWIIN